METPNQHGTRRPSLFTIIVLIYFGIAAVLIALAPFTGGVTLSGLCFLGAAATIHGLAYVLRS